MTILVCYTAIFLVSSCNAPPVTTLNMAVAV